jgi:hypothetical protein
MNLFEEILLAACGRASTACEIRDGGCPTPRGFRAVKGLYYLL